MLCWAHGCKGLVAMLGGVPEISSGDIGDGEE